MPIYTSRLVTDSGDRLVTDTGDYLIAFAELVNAGYPDVTVEIAFGQAPLTASPTWTALPAEDLIGLNITIGKQEALDKVQPGVLTLTLDNSDRAYDATYTAGPYYGNLKPGVRIRVTVQYGVAAYQVFDGFVDGWPGRYRPGQVSVSTVTATDASKYLRRRIATSPYSQAVTTTNPTYWFHLGETSGTRLYDAKAAFGSGGSSWAADRSKYTAESLVVSGDGALKLPGAPDTTGGRIGMIADPTPFSIEFWFKADKPPQGVYGDWASILWGGGLGVQVASTTYNSGLGAGALRFVITDGVHGVVAETTVGSFCYSICDGVAHHVVCTFNGAATQAHIWVDGIDRLMAQTVTPGLPGLFFLGSPSLNFVPSWDGDATLDELAVYSSVELTGTQASTHYLAGFQPWNGDLTGTRTARMLDVLGWPAGWRDIDPGQQVLGVAAWSADETFMGYLDLLTATEQGRWGVEWWDSGKIYFRDRVAVYTDPRSTTVQAAFTDDAAATSGIRYESLDLSYDEAQLLRSVTVKWSGGEVTVADPALTATDLYRAATVETLLATEDEARSLGSYLISRYGVPFMRVKSITVRPARLSNGVVSAWQDDAWAACLGLRDGDRVTVRVQPQGIGSAVTLTCLVEGKEHEAGDGVAEWTTTFYLSPIDATAPTWWVLGTGALGSTTVLSF
jgi:hypothetical protein